MRYHQILGPLNGASFNGINTGTSNGYSFGLPFINTLFRVAPTVSLLGTWTYSSNNNTATVSVASASIGNTYLLATGSGLTSLAIGYFGCSAGGAIVADMEL
jgi:hypothetical protein